MFKPDGDARPPESEERCDRASDTLGLDAFRQSAQDAGVSLDKLSAAMAKMFSAGDDPYTSPADAQTADNERDLSAGGSGDRVGAAGASTVADGCEISPRTILEALLFVGSPSGEPIAGQSVAALMRGVRPAEIDALVRELNVQYTARRCPYHIVSVGAGYRLSLRDEFARVRDKFYGKVRQARLSQAAIEVLSAVAYHESLTAEEVSKLRGTPSGQILAQLVRRQLLRLEAGDKKSRRARYYTTERFLELFGLESLADLPRSQDLEQPSGEAISDER
jgi:segregation and condensation protein B